jgi:hypothetical protein
MGTLLYVLKVLQPVSSARLYAMHANASFGTGPPYGRFTLTRGSHPQVFKLAKVRAQSQSMHHQ